MYNEFEAGSYVWIVDPTTNEVMDEGRVSHYVTTRWGRLIALDDGKRAWRAHWAVAGSRS